MADVADGAAVEHEFQHVAGSGAICRAIVDFSRGRSRDGVDRRVDIRRPAVAGRQLFSGHVDRFGVSGSRCCATGSVGELHRGHDDCRSAPGNV